jgi:hypothetical protein
MKKITKRERMNFEVNLSKPYGRGLYNKSDDHEQWIRISEGCPNNCEYCRETKECGVKPIYFDIPKIVRNKVKIMDMNLIYKPKVLEIIKELGSKRVNDKVVYYELICGIDYRFMTLEIAQALKDNRFQNIRFAWDYGMDRQYKIKDMINMLLKVGYKAKEISCFMVCNWKVSFEIRCLQLDLLKIWNIKVNDCWFDNQLSPNIKPIYWTEEQIKSFRSKVRKHNMLVNFRIDPELKQMLVGK